MTKTPKFEIVKKELLEYIGKMPGDQDYLPYENDLGRMFNVSKRTVRRALLDLRNEGIIDTGQKRGSRVIRSLTPSLKSDLNLYGKFLDGAAIASVFLADRAGGERTGFLPWRITGELEARSAKAGGRLVVYNLRDEKWKDFETVAKSMVDNGVEWFFCFLHEKLVDIIPMNSLLRNQLKPVVYIQTLEQIDSFASILCEGVDMISTNHSTGVYECLCRDFPDVDFIAYVGATADSRWEQHRINAVRRYADTRRIPLEVALGSMDINTDNWRNEGHYDKDQASRAEYAFSATAKLVKRVKNCRRPLLIGANDVYAGGIIHCLEEKGINVPGSVEVLGYDNSTVAMQNNLTSFYQDQKKISDSAFEFCRMFYADKGRILRQSNARIIPPLLFKRMSTR